MAFSSIFHSNSSSRKFCQFEIRPESDFIVLHGSVRETPDFKFKGNVVLMTSDPLSIRGIRVTIEGKRRTAHNTLLEERLLNPQLPAIITTKKTFLSITKLVTPDVTKPLTLAPSNYEFPFEFDLKGDLPESIEGMGSSYIVYSLRAIADRGKLSKDLLARRHLRIVRTLGHDRTETLRSADVSGVWPNKIKYQITSPSRAVIFGTSVTTQFELTPLLEKLTIGTTKVRLEEKRKIRTVPGPDRETETGWQDMWVDSQIIRQEVMDIPDNADAIDEELQMPMKKFKFTLPLPTSLRQCRQSVAANEWIRIEHIMHYDIVLHNPDGHKSEIKAHHSIILYISPQLPIDENLETNRSTVDLNGDMQIAPPLYGTHQLDMLYEDIDTASFTTPAGGSSSTSRDPSRNPSYDDLAGLRTGGSDPLPENLRDRLERLRLNQRRVSEATIDEETNHDGHLQDTHVASQDPYNMVALERMPSYGTAVRTPVRTPFSEAPPSYATATSRPPSSES